MERPGTSASRPGSTAAGRMRRGTETLSNVANRLRTPMYISDRAMPAEGDAVRTIEALLQIPAANGRTEDELAASCMGPDMLVTDLDFEPGPSSLYPNPEQPPATAVGATTWRRVAGALYLPTGKTPRLLQGALGNHYFLGAVAAVGCKQDLLLDLIVSDDQAAQGCYTFQFYKHGCWQRVVIDNFLPCMEGEERLAFACSGHVGELWPSFLEKAYAKLHGSYYALEGGPLADCLTDLTGGVSHKLKLDDPEIRQLAVRGALWDQLCMWLGTGGVVACQAKTTHAEDEPTGPGGVLLNHIYSILDARAVDAKTKLLRVQCPWPAPGGVWHGSWAAGTSEWSSSADAQRLAAEVADTFQDEATFWINYIDFIDIFNRLYVCRMFPPSWHQLTLHCGWQGPSAGGPYLNPTTGYLPSLDGPSLPPSPSSTWCCNPQFRLTVRKACEVVVCLGQQDPRVEHRTHVKKAMRKRTIGMTVLRVPTSSLGRRWEVRPGELLMEAPLSAGREVTVTFRAEPEWAYVVVPYTGRAGDEAAFVLRTFSGSALEVEQLPSPLSLVLGGSWAGFLAGGSSEHPTFGSNPQYMISTQHRTQVVLSVSRLDIKYAVLKPSFSSEQCVGLYLCAPEKGPDGLAARKSAVRSPSEVLQESGFVSMEEAVMMITLEPEAPYVLIPALSCPGVEAPFELRIMSAVPVELVPLPELKSVVVAGEWREDNAGGCDLQPTWRKNPRFLLALQQSASIKITLSKVGKLAKARANVDDMVGFYVLRAHDPSGAVRGDLRKSVVAETTFVTTAENTAEYELEGGVPYVIIPCTYSPGRVGRFTLALSGGGDFELVEL